MKPKLSQKELWDLVTEETTSIWAYNTLYEIEIRKNDELYLKKVLTATIDANYPSKSITPAGQFQAMTPERAQIYLQNAENWS